MLRVVLARLDFYRVGTHRLVIVNQVVHLALLAVVVIVELVAMCTKFLGHHILIDGTKVDAADIVEHRTDVVAIEYAGKKTHIVQIELQKIFLLVLLLLLVVPFLFLIMLKIVGLIC